MTNKIPTLEQYREWGYTTIAEIYDSLSTIIINKDLAIKDLQSELEKRDKALAAGAKALEHAMDWLSSFGEHAPIVFGGEGELYEELYETRYGKEE